MLHPSHTFTAPCPAVAAHRCRRPLQEFELSEADLEGQQLPLKLVKFTKVGLGPACCCAQHPALAHNLLYQPGALSLPPCCTMHIAALRCRILCLCRPKLNCLPSALSDAADISK